MERKTKKRIGIAITCALAGLFACSGAMLTNGFRASAVDAEPAAEKALYYVDAGRMAKAMDGTGEVGGGNDGWGYKSIVPTQFMIKYGLTFAGSQEEGGGEAL